MNHTNLGINVDLTAVAWQDAVDLEGITPYGRGFNAVVQFNHNALAGASFVGKVQTSPDNSNWTDVMVTPTGVKAPKTAQITLDRYIRAGVTDAGSAGVGSFELLI